MAAVNVYRSINQGNTLTCTASNIKPVQQVPELTCHFVSRELPRHYRERLNLVSRVRWVYITSWATVQECLLHFELQTTGKKSALIDRLFSYLLFLYYFFPRLDGLPLPTTPSTRCQVLDNWMTPANEMKSLEHRDDPRNMLAQRLLTLDDYWTIYEPSNTSHQTSTMNSTSDNWPKTNSGCNSSSISQPTWRWVSYKQS